MALIFEIVTGCKWCNVKPCIKVISPFAINALIMNLAAALGWEKGYRL